MSEKSSATRKPFFSGEPFERLVALLIAVVTIMAAMVAFLQSDAGSRSTRASREAQQNEIQAIGIKSRGEVQAGYAWSDAYRLWLELDTLAFESQQTNEPEAARRYREVRDRVAGLSPLLSAPYFDPTSGNLPNFNAFEADLYLVQATALTERFTNASNANNAWSGKSDTYVALLTLLAVTLFLYGLSTTIVGRMSWLFVGMGSVITTVTLVWAVITVLAPVPMLPDEAIVAYARGVGLAYQNMPVEAADAFGQALAAAPDYANAYYERGNVNVAQNQLERAAADYQAALAAGRGDVNVLWNLGWTYYRLGRLGDAIATTQTAIGMAPDQIALRFNLGLAHLARGELAEAQAVYADGIALGTQQVADARAAGQEPPASLWSYMSTATSDLANLLNCQYDQVCTAAPPYNVVSATDTIKTATEGLNTQLRDLVVALEYTGQPPTAASTTVNIGQFEFVQGVYAEDGALIAYEPLPTQSSKLRFGMVQQEQSELADISAARRSKSAIDQVWVRFDYQGLQAGQLIVVKTYLNGKEVVGLRLVESWKSGTEGQAVLPLTPDASFTLSPGDYRVEIYVDSHLLQRSGFTIT